MYVSTFMYYICIILTILVIKSKNSYNPYKNEKYHEKHNFNKLLEIHNHLKLEKQLLHISENFKFLFDKFKKYNTDVDAKSNKKNILFIERNINSLYKNCVELDKKFEKKIFRLIEPLKSKDSKILSEKYNIMKFKRFNPLNYTKQLLFSEIEPKHKLISHEKIKKLESQIHHIYESYEKLYLYYTEELSKNNSDTVSFAWSLLSRIMECREIIEYIAINDLKIHKNDLY